MNLTHCDEAQCERRSLRESKCFSSIFQLPTGLIVHLPFELKTCLLELIGSVVRWPGNVVVRVVAGLWVSLENERRR